MTTQYDVIIIGGGVIGCAIAYVLGKQVLSIALLDKNPDVAMGTSGKNSAVVHAGFNNRPGSLMAKYCVEGNKKFEAICKMLDVPYKRTGKLVVSFSDEDDTIIDKIISDGKKNNCIGLSKIDKKKIAKLEPEIIGKNALLSANTAVFDPFLYTINLCEAAIQNGASFFMNNDVKSISREGDFFIVRTDSDEYRCQMLVNSAGLYADKVSAMAGDPSYTIFPCRGEYLILDTDAGNLLSRPVYPVPRPGIGGLGVHLTPTIDGNVLVGPSAEYIDDPEDYSTTVSMMDNLFKEAQILLPTLEKDMIIGAYTGIRPKLVAKGQANYGDFIIEESLRVKNLINLIGIESPGFTASIPIAEKVAEIIRTKKKTKPNSQFKAKYKGPVCFSSLGQKEQNDLIAKNQDYGEIVCRCKMVTKAEVLQALHNPLKSYTITSIKNRVHTTRGRCQGGYCLPKLIDNIMDEIKIPPEDVKYRLNGDIPFPGRVKF
jgi:glycerol-3-phosphate dehydrogenase